MAQPSPWTSLVSAVGSHVCAGQRGLNGVEGFRQQGLHLQS